MSSVLPSTMQNSTIDAVFFAESSSALRGYVLTVAEAVAKHLIPVMDPAHEVRARECITVLLRVAEGLSPDLSAKRPAESGMIDQIQRLDETDLRLEAARQALFMESGAGRIFDRQKLEAYLRAHALGGPSLNIVNARQLAGGRSKQTVLATQQGSDHLPEAFVMRQDWAAGGVQGTTVVTEFELLRILAAAGLKVPVPLLLECSSTPLGAPFMIVTCMSGTSQGGYFDPPKSAPLALQLAEQLAGIHQIPLEALSTTSLRNDPETHQQRLDTIEGYRRTYTQLSEPVTAIDMAIQWLIANSDRVRGKFSLIHNDVGAHNLLVDGDELVAVLDWELASIGNPAADLGYARSWLEQILPWDSFMRSYRAAGGPAIDDATLDFYTLLSRVRLYTMLLQARAGIAAGVIHDLEITHICSDSLPRLLRCMCIDLARILAAG